MPELRADPAEYQILVDDMVKNSGLLIPEPNWLMSEDVSQPAASYDKQKALEFALSTEHFATKVSKMEALMHAWVGGSTPPTPEDISKYYRFLKHGDVLDLWPANIKGNNIALFRQDLGTLMDLNLLYAFSASSHGKVTRVLEVGPGYGRLAEAAFNVFGPSVQYVMIDSVPASLYYSKEYLSRVCPDARIGSYYDAGDDFDLGRYDIAIIPAWHFERVNTLRYDVCVNIESMQEMSQYHVDYYLNLFQSVAEDGATIYLSNAHDYYFRGSFSYPTNWQALFCANTPRSWTPDHPTEIFRKSGQDYSLPNRMCESIHKYSMTPEPPRESVTRHGVRRLIVPMFQGAIFGLSHYASLLRRRLT